MNIDISNLVKTSGRIIFSATVRKSKQFSETWEDTTGSWSLLITSDNDLKNIEIELQAPTTIEEAFIKAFICKGEQCPCHTNWGSVDTKEDSWVKSSTSDTKVIFCSIISVPESYRSDSEPEVRLHYYFRWHKKVESEGVKLLFQDLKGFYNTSLEMTGVVPSHSYHQNEGNTEGKNEVGEIDRAFEDIGLYDFNFIIIAKGNRYFRANKNMLKVRSPYFRTMFQGEWKEAKNNEATFDFPPEVVAGVMEFIYTGMVSSVAPDFAEDWLKLSDILESNEFKEMVEAGLINSLDVDNAVSYIVLAERHKANNLLMKATSFLKENMNAVVSTGVFKDLMKHSPMDVEVVLRALGGNGK